MSHNTTIQDRYATRLAEDLESNAKEQEAVREQVAELQARLTRLEDERAWLTRLEGTVATGGPDATAREEPAEEEPAEEVPVVAAPVVEAPAAVAARAPQEGKARAVPRPRARKPAAGAKSRKAGKKAAPAEEKEKPTLRGLVADVLADDNEPRMVSEFVDALAKRHPDRSAPTAPVVRNALEALVAKGLAERSRRQGSVFYTPVTPSAGTAGDGAGAAASEAGEPVAAKA
ncbi:hypothetical protein [Actinacidiphila glaucinigra]|uniref:Regulatory protein n=1 Tax=Actinacidiphila glaucinigra TaxID=235986 RepID=A0A239MZM5_9ACTN|nr:hypothetical protein [Actinacidiphila glaucinigra]SNT48085.1 hypothetical protein SAMN05216252_12976 [Actinacidiphila glaucinigra]